MQLRDRHAIAVLLLALAAGACDSGTGGRPVTFTLRLAAATGGPAGPGTFSTASGWEVTLEEACLAVGPVYLWVGDAHLAAAAPKSWFRWPSLVRRAYAHPGDNHFNGGAVRGEWPAQAVFRPLAGEPLVVTGLNGLAGPVRSFSLYLDPPRGPQVGDPCLRGHHAYVVGVARRGEAIIPFEGGLDIDGTGTRRRVEGVALVGDLDQGSEVQVTVDVAGWFDTAEFDRLATTNPAGRFVITPTSAVRDAWFIGIRRAGSFTGQMGPAASKGTPP